MITRQIEEANDQKTSAFINISHELKTPLTLISNYLDRYMRDKMPADLYVVRQNTDKIIRDINNTLDFVKMEKGMVHYDHDQTADISDIITKCAFQFKDFAVRKKIVYEYDVMPGIFSKINPSAIDRIANNLIDNAIKYTEPGGKITVTLKAGKDEIELAVTDTGIGISREIQDHIFDPYFQVSHNKSNMQGIGMGLNIVKRIIESADGKISVESKPGIGTTFKVVLNRYHPDAKENISVVTKKENVPGQLEISLPEETHDKYKKTVLVVEDKIEMLAYLHNELSNEYNIINAVNGREALDKLSGVKKPDIIISDIMMDIMDGYEFYEKVLQFNEYKSIPFIFLTA